VNLLDSITFCCFSPFHITMEAPTYESSGSSPNRTHEKDGGIHSTIDVDHDHGADTDLHRSLSTRHLTMIALGSSIGMGLWLGSGTSLVNGGPAAIFIGYLLSGTMIWAVSHSIGEMAVVYPLPSAFVQWSSIFISEPAGFTLGWSYWFQFFITLANELQVGLLQSRLGLDLTGHRAWSPSSTSGQTRCLPLRGLVSSG
jgi:amino acid transporter